MTHFLGIDASFVPYDIYTDKNIFQVIIVTYSFKIEYLQLWL